MGVTSDWKQEAFNPRWADDPITYVVRGAVAKAVHDLIAAGPAGLTDENIISGLIAEAHVRLRGVEGARGYVCDDLEAVAGAVSAGLRAEASR